MHSYIDPVQVNENGVLVEKGGFARIKTIIDSVKKQNENTFVLDGGDFSMGTLYQSVFSEKALELRLLGLMGYQATTIGNHEFDYRSDGLAKMLPKPVMILCRSSFNPISIGKLLRVNIPKCCINQWRITVLKNTRSFKPVI